MTTGPTHATIEGSLRLGAGFRSDEREMAVARLARLGDRLRSFRHDQVDMELSVKERARPTQSVTLDCRVAGRSRAVGTGVSPDLERAIAEARDEVVRQLTDALTRSEPRNRRDLRATIRGGPGGG